MHGLLNKKYLNEIKQSATYKDDTFAREYLGKWTGANSESWFDYDKMTKYRKIINPELSEKLRGNKEIFYLLSVDVGRYTCQTVVTVFKILPQESHFRIAVPNIVVLGLSEQEKHFERQAIALKKMIQSYNAKYVIIDGNGLGSGFMDYMVKENFDNGVIYPGYCSTNDEHYRQNLYPNSIPLIYVMKANATLDGQIHSNCYTKVASGNVTFLAREQEIKNRLLSTKKGQSMKIEDRVKRLIPHQMTTRLFEEMSNLKLKQTGLDIKLEQINSNMGKDKFSSFEYGLWRIKELEEEYYKKWRKNKGQKRKLVFYTQGGR